MRSHWGIENSWHGVLDMTMNEDQHRSRIGHGPRIWPWCAAWRSIWHTWHRRRSPPCEAR